MALQQTVTVERPIAIISAFISLFIAPIAFAAPPTWEQRLEKLETRIEKARVETHVPGLALAVVKDDEIVFARGFGLADIEAERPVTPETLFAIGSTTKAFTSTVIGMLVDEGRMSWDDPATRYLPYFTLGVDSDENSNAILLRDMLSHHTGYTRMSILFVNGEVPREEILRTANAAEPLAKYREKFLYNNVMYMAAGMCAGVASDSSWEDLIRTRIFEPLHMTNSNLTSAEAHADDRMSRGYRWDTEDEQFVAESMRNIDVIGPAGSINSNVLDMSNWIRFQLGRGMFEGTQLMSPESHDEAWTPQTQIAPGASYGLGWMIRDWNGHQLVEHGGNIDGYAAEVALLPDDQVGFVMLTNTGFSSLQQSSIDIVFDALLGDWEIGEDAPSRQAGGDLKKFEGTYVANYAQFNDEKFTVTVNEDGYLALDIPSQRVFVLKDENEDGRRPFDGIPQIAASFDINEKGDVEILRLYQGGLQFEIPREGYEYPIEVPLEELTKYVGMYHFAEQNHDVEVLIKHNRLAVDVPGQMVFGLASPDENGNWAFRNSDVVKLSVSFAQTEFGAVESMTLNQMGREFVLPRIASTETPLPTLDELFALRKSDDRAKAMKAAGIVRLSGSLRAAQSGVNGSFTTLFDDGKRFRQDMRFGKFGSVCIALNGDRGWANPSFDEFRELKGGLLEQARDDHPATFFGDWRGFFDEIRIERTTELDNVPCLIVKMKRGDRPTSTAWIEAATGDVLKVEGFQELPDLGGVRLPVTTTFGGWRDVRGLRLPTEMIVSNEQSGRMIMQIDEVETNVQVSDEAFILTPDG